MLAFENILQRIESEISQLQFTNPPKSLYEPIESTSYPSEEKEYVRR